MLKKDFTQKRSFGICFISCPSVFRLSSENNRCIFVLLLCSLETMVPTLSQYYDGDDIFFSLLSSLSATGALNQMKIYLITTETLSQKVLVRKRYDLLNSTFWMWYWSAIFLFHHEAISHYLNVSSPLYHTGHIGIAVPDVYAACKVFEEKGVTFVKKPDDGIFFSFFPDITLSHNYFVLCLGSLWKTHLCVGYITIYFHLYQSALSVFSQFVDATFKVISPHR